MVRKSRRLDHLDMDVAFAEPFWNEDSPGWREIDQRVPEHHLARVVDRAVDRLDLRGLMATYQGRGSLPLRPDLLLKMIVYEMLRGYASPNSWFEHARDCDALKWLGFGLQPSRATCYDFRDRLAPFWDQWNEQVLTMAQDLELLSPQRAALDGTSVAAWASRHVLLKEHSLENRLNVLAAAIAADAAQEPLAENPRWLAKHPATRLAQQERYQQARLRLQQRQAENQQRRASKRRDPKKVVVSAGDPEAACGRDKHDVFRPLYNVQIAASVDTPFLLAYDVFNRPTDAGTLQPMLQRIVQFTGHKPEVLLCDPSYASLADLELCQLHGIQLFAPVGVNDYSEKNQRKPSTNQFTQLAKTQFTWLAERDTYRCPEGHLLVFERKQRMQRAHGQSVQSSLYRCPAEHCTGCPRQKQCTPTPSKGRTVSRLENEELIEELRARMRTPQAKALYRMRGQSVERAFADFKEHRSLRRFRGRGLGRAKAQLGALVLAHNLTTLEQKVRSLKTGLARTRTLEKMAG